MAVFAVRVDLIRPRGSQRTRVTGDQVHGIQAPQRHKVQHGHDPRRHRGADSVRVYSASQSRFREGFPAPGPYFLFLCTLDLLPHGSLSPPGSFLTVWLITSQDHARLRATLRPKPARLSAPRARARTRRGKPFASTPRYLSQKRSLLFSIRLTLFFH